MSYLFKWHGDLSQFMCVFIATAYVKAIFYSKSAKYKEANKNNVKKYLINYIFWEESGLKANVVLNLYNISIYSTFLHHFSSLGFYYTIGLETPVILAIHQNQFLNIRVKKSSLQVLNIFPRNKTVLTTHHTDGSHW